MVAQKKYKDYESAMSRLEQITEQLEAGTSKLEEAIKLYTEGLEIARYCHEKLAQAEAKIKIIAKKSGQFVEEAFQDGEDE